MACARTQHPSAVRLWWSFAWRKMTLMPSKPTSLKIIRGLQQFRKCGIECCQVNSDLCEQSTKIRSLRRSGKKGSTRQRKAVWWPAGNWNSPCKFQLPPTQSWKRFSHTKIWEPKTAKNFLKLLENTQSYTEEKSLVWWYSLNVSHGSTIMLNFRVKLVLPGWQKVFTSKTHWKALQFCGFNHFLGLGAEWWRTWTSGWDLQQKGDTVSKCHTVAREVFLGGGRENSRLSDLCLLNRAIVTEL